MGKRNEVISDQGAAWEVGWAGKEERLRRGHPDRVGVNAERRVRREEGRRGAEAFGRKSPPFIPQKLRAGAEVT